MPICDGTVDQIVGGSADVWNEVTIVRCQNVSGYPSLFAYYGHMNATVKVGRTTYQQLPATTDIPAQVVVRSSLKGPYLDVRRFLSSLLHDHAGAALLDLSVSRTTVELDTVDTRVAVVFFLAASSPAAIEPASAAASAALNPERLR